ncbi:hypothetical protein PHYC_02120 [Phycisphaerales bacterium]|nr:hypothetical protein PHYC_02120 [Phycisphaerales bacterium]
METKGAPCPAPTTNSFTTPSSARSTAKPDITERLYAYMGGIVRANDGALFAINGPEDHVHLYFRWRPDATVSDLMRDVKAGSSGWIHDEFPGLRAFAWQEGNRAFTVSKSQEEIVKKYIANQRAPQERRLQERVPAPPEGARDRVRRPVRLRLTPLGPALHPPHPGRNRNTRRVPWVTRRSRPRRSTHGYKLRAPAGARRASGGARSLRPVPRGVRDPCFLDSRTVRSSSSETAVARPSTPPARP